MHGVKKEARIIGIDDGPFDKFKDKTAIIVGAVFKGGISLDALLSTKIKIDGEDSTKKIIDMINTSKYKPQIQCIMLDGIAFGGFNIVDIDELNKKTDIPILIIMRKLPDTVKIKKTLNKLGMQKKTGLLDHEIKRYNNLFYQSIGIDDWLSEQFIKIAVKNADIPEPLRIAHIIASGIVRGESYGKA